MDALPDELLLLVFGCIRDGLTLLDGVALVCKRWLALSRDPRAWASVELECSSAEAHGLYDRPSRGARVLLHAPALRTLAMRNLFRPHISALLRTGAVVRDRLECTSTFQFMPDQGAAVALLELMARSPSLRSVWLFVDEEVLAARDALGRGLLAVVAPLTALRRLNLGYYVDVASLPTLYQGEFEDGGLPHLRRLELSFETFDDDGEEERPGAPDSMVMHLTRAAADSLRTLEVAFPEQGLSAELVAALTACRGLESATLTSLRPGLLPHWPGLHHLELTLTVNDPTADVDRLRLLLDEAAALESLKRFKLAVGYLYEEEPGAEAVAARAIVKEVVAAFQQHRPTLFLEFRHWEK